MVLVHGRELTQRKHGTLRLVWSSNIWRAMRPVLTHFEKPSNRSVWRKYKKIVENLNRLWAIFDGFSMISLWFLYGFSMNMTWALRCHTMSYDVIRCHMKSHDVILCFVLCLEGGAPRLQRVGISICDWTRWGLKDLPPEIFQCWYIDTQTIWNTIWKYVKYQTGPVQKGVFSWASLHGELLHSGTHCTVQVNIMWRVKRLQRFQGLDHGVKIAQNGCSFHGSFLPHDGSWWHLYRYRIIQIHLLCHLLLYHSFYPSTVV